MIRIAQVIWSGNFGGIEKLAMDLCMVQKNNQELEVELIVAKNEGSYLEEIKKQNIIHHSIGLKGGADFSMVKYKKLKHLFSRFDIIHLHAFNLLIACAAIRSGKKIIFTEHGNFGFGRKKKISDRMNSFFLKLFLKKYVNYISFNSMFTEQIAIARYQLKKENCEVIYNGINFSERLPVEMPDQNAKEKLEGKFVVGTSSRFAGFKRIDRLIRAFAEFEAGKETVLLLVGDGVMRKELEQLTHELNVAGRTIFTGYRTDVKQLQQAMDVCVFPSENEPFGLVAIEALSLGKPVIVFHDGGGIVEILRGAFDEDVVENVHQLSKRIRYYYELREKKSNPETRIQHARQFDIIKTEKLFFNLYKKAIA